MPSSVAHRVSCVALLGVLACSTTEAPAPKPSSKPAPSAAPHAPAEPPAAAGAIAPRLRAAAGGLLLTWIEPTGGKKHRVRFARFMGRGWGKASTIAQGEGIVANWADAPSAIRAADGTLYAHWPERSGKSRYAYDVKLARSTDGGKAWSPLGAAHDDGTATEHGFVSFVPDGRAMRLFWLDGRATASGGAMQLRTARLGDDGVKKSTVVDPRVCDCCGTSAALGGGGPIVAYRDRSEAEQRDIALVRRDGDSWKPPTRLNDDGWIVPGCPVNGPMLAAEGKRVVAAWTTHAGGRGRVLVAFSKNGGERFSSAMEIDAPNGRRTPIGRVDVVVDGNGAIVSWLASEREEASLLMARVSFDGRVGTPMEVARVRASRDSGFPQLERVGDRLFVAWTKTPAALGWRVLRRSELAEPTERMPSTSPGVTIAKPGAVAPQLRATDLEGAVVSTDILKGKPYLLNVWATWCEPCRHELGALAAWSKKHANVKVVAISVDPKASRDAVMAFAKRRKLPFAVWHDPADASSRALGVTTLPATVLVGSDGKVVWSKSGAIRADDPDLAAAVDAIPH